MARVSRSADERTLLEMFSYMRPKGSRTESLFIEKYLTPLGFTRDRHRNLVLKIGDSPSILWSSHMDTVHRTEGFQTLHYDGTTLALSKASKNGPSSCLGADDTAGVWLMTEMVKAGVEGLYVIHHGEESGCIGSSAMAAGDWSIFDGIKAAIAFDRYGYEDVITHQANGRTASDAFAKSLCNILGGSFEPSSWGVYTDTNEYAHIIPECTNVSVGYFHQHTKRETQDVQFLIALRNVLVAADFSSLVIEREPQMPGHWWDDDYESENLNYGYGSSSGIYRSSSTTRKRRSFDYGYTSSSSSSYSGTSIEDLCKAYPEVAADILSQCGITRGDLLDQIALAYGKGAGFTDDDEFDDPFGDIPALKTA